MSIESRVRLDVSQGDRMYPVAAAVERLTGQRPHPTTVCRWCHKGSAGIVLPSLIVSGRRMTSLEAVGEWLHDVTDARNQLRAGAAAITGSES